MTVGSAAAVDSGGDDDEERGRGGPTRSCTTCCAGHVETSAQPSASTNTSCYAAVAPTSTSHKVGNWRKRNLNVRRTFVIDIQEEMRAKKATRISSMSTGSSSSSNAGESRLV